MVYALRLVLLVKELTAAFVHAFLGHSAAGSSKPNAILKKLHPRGVPGKSDAAGRVILPEIRKGKVSNRGHKLAGITVA